MKFYNKNYIIIAHSVNYFQEDLFFLFILSLRKINIVFYITNNIYILLHTKIYNV